MTQNRRQLRVAAAVLAIVLLLAAFLSLSHYVSSDAGIASGSSPPGTDDVLALMPSPDTSEDLFESFLHAENPLGDDVCSYDAPFISGADMTSGTSSDTTGSDAESTETLPADTSDIVPPDTESTPLPPVTEPVTSDTDEDSESVTSESTEQPVHKHCYVAKKSVKPTCEQNGYTTYVCSGGATYTDTVPSLGHSWQETKRREPTRVLDGFVESVCIRCKTMTSTVLPHLRDIADTDMCGESLIEKPLPHAKDYELMKQVFDLYHAKYPLVVVGGANRIPIPQQYAENPWSILEEYAYFREAYSVYTVVGDATHPSKLIVFYDEARAAKAAESYARAREILAELGINSSVTQKEAIIRINNYLCDMKRYDYDVLNGVVRADASTHHSIFDSLGICHNYSIAFQVLCLSAGIECHYFSSPMMNHAWNVVYFSDGSCMHVDVCWNDARVSIDGVSYEVDYDNTSADFRETLRSRYLLLTPDEMRASHPF